MSDLMMFGGYYPFIIMAIWLVAGWLGSRI